VRVPFSEIYRAFPELDGFSDAECKRFVQRARAEKARVRAMESLTAFAGLSGLILGALLGGIVTNVLSAVAVSWVHPRTLEEGVRPIMIVVAAGLCAAGAAAFVRDGWLRNAITKRLSQAACPGCGYSLLGLKPVNGHVTCPECALPVSLVDRGLTQADLLARITCRCGEGLAGVPSEGGAITCPVCGERLELAKQGLTEQDVLLASATSTMPSAGAGAEADTGAGTGPSADGESRAG
jgi:uncharacterized Zn finger protein (UPF0148 family)